MAINHTAELKQALERTLEQGVSEHVFPGGISFLMLRDGGQVLASCGTTNVTSSETPQGDSLDKAPVTSETVFDAASLTKVVVTLPLILLAVQQGKLELDQPAVTIVPELDQAPDRELKQTITVRHLLTHTSGLPAWRPFFVRLQGHAAYLAHIGAEPLEHEPGGAVIYSDLGFILLGCIAERVHGARIDQLATTLLFDPLRMTRSAYRPLEQLVLDTAAFAPTEIGNEFERGMAQTHIRALANAELREGAFALAAGDLNRLPWRKSAIRGEVHDANAHYGLSGISGHAGLFATVTDLAKYAQIWLEPSLISSALVAEALKPATVAADGLFRGLGWIVEADGSFGHTGFTGTSMWYDRSADFMLISLTNRIHPHVKDGIKAWRDEQRRSVRKVLAGI